MPPPQTGVIMEDWVELEIADNANWQAFYLAAKELPYLAAQKQAELAKPKVSAHPRWKNLRPAVAASRLTMWSADVGYAKWGGTSQSSLAHIAEYGSAYKAPRPAMEPASEETIAWYFEQCVKVAAVLR